MAKVFIDDSGSSSDEPVQYIAGWVGHVPTWNEFSEEWETALAAQNPKPIEYFKQYEARSQKGCFAGFAESEANTKTRNLAEVVTRHNINGVVYGVERSRLNRMIEEHALTIRGEVHQYLQDPFYICMQSLVGFGLGAEYAKHPNDKVDFIFDGTPDSAQAKRYITMWEVCCELLPEPIPNLMGTAIPMNDKEVPPIQAADLLAGQMRMAAQLQADPEPLRLMRQHRPILIQAVDDITVVVQAGDANARL
jgi:hypothetical protein